MDMGLWGFSVMGKLELTREVECIMLMEEVLSVKIRGDS